VIPADDRDREPTARLQSAAEPAPSAADPYYPPPDSAGGWRFARSDSEVRESAGLDPPKLRLEGQEHQWLFGGDTWAISVIRNGILAAEFRTFNVLDASRFDIWSATKSFTSLAFGILLGDRTGDPQAASGLTLDSPAYDFITEGHPLTDDRKRLVTVRHLLTMTGGFAGQSRMAFGTPTSLGEGLFEFALGRVPNRHGCDAATLIADPGTRWEYSDPGYAHLALVFAHAAGTEIDEFLNQRLFGPIGVPPVSWTRAGGGDLIGPHTVPHTGLVLSARELARVGYLLLRGGSWEGRTVVPKDWIDLATSSSQDLNPNYGYGFWTNAAGTLWPGAPSDAFALMGFRGNRCWVVPSLDLVVARTGSGPAVIDDHYFPMRVLDALL
jgi:CubicO group peptidase (beta-lactamase class C family)